MSPSETPAAALALALEPPVPTASRSGGAGYGAASISAYDFSQLDILAQQRRLLEVGVTGELIFESAQQADPPLSTKLQKLWAERGDFSKFSTKALTIKDSEDADQDGEGDGTIAVLGIDDEDDDGHSEGKVAGASGQQTGNTSVSQQQSSNIHSSAMISIPEMIALKERMLAQLTAAQHAVHFSNMLLSLLIAGAKPAAAPTFGTALKTASRAGSPELGAGKAGSSTGGGGAGVGGTQAAEDGGWGIDPSVIGLTRIALKEDPSESPAYLGDTANSARGDGQGLSAAQVNALKSEAEIAHERALALGMQRDGITSAIAILRRGAEQIRSAVGASASPSESGAEAAQPQSPSRRALAERIRWEGLKRLKSGTSTEAGLSGGGAWGVRGGKPIEMEMRRKSGLLVQGMPNVNKAEEARDAWIGWGVPESHPRYRRRTLAYFASEATLDSKADGQELPDDPAAIPDHIIAKHIVIPDRPNKRLRVAFKLRTSGKAAHVAESSKVVDAIGEEEVLLCSDLTNGEESAQSAETTIDAVLQRAVDEIADVELFDEITRQARQLSSTYDISISAESVKLALTPDVTLSYEFVPTCVTSATHEKTSSSARHEAHQVEGKGTAEHYSPIAAALCWVARLALVQKYKRVARAMQAGDEASLGTHMVPHASEANASVLAPVIGLFLYCRTASALKGKLSELRTEFPECTLVFEPFASVQDVQKWLASFIGGIDLARSQLCGTVTVLRTSLSDRKKARRETSTSVSNAIGKPQNEQEQEQQPQRKKNQLVPIALIELSFPSEASIEFPLKESSTSSGSAKGNGGVSSAGVRLDRVGVDKATEYLREELNRLRETAESFGA
ncbi:hypothetical protein K437DRAFT_55569 [Tilletiaria anomala UBC 951]|uniref:Mediator of RNA polymerase II transcription subunit 17 n=1 Tax=Tilletiaria anomala (strain ATCC 24038 / CBS 436.72 / UBC 951) TaxID=1037660 RepID=A0A066WJX2_TILAU|nr:uncharacterized protein K437DRAFT_55569 [Tilletiaria anomala UBC 951]KDN51314.1 hypothetical protein K437DRAFT_55569 [Tilletiaria anomala UBC 951]